MTTCSSDANHALSMLLPHTRPTTATYVQCQGGFEISKLDHLNRVSNYDKSTRPSRSYDECHYAFEDNRENKCIDNYPSKRRHLSRTKTRQCMCHLASRDREQGRLMILREVLKCLSTDKFLWIPLPLNFGALTETFLSGLHAVPVIGMTTHASKCSPSPPTLSQFLESSTLPSDV